MKHSITIRMGASEYSLQVNDIKIDLSKLTKEQAYEARKGLIEPLKLQGYFGKKLQRKAQYRAQALSPRLTRKRKGGHHVSH